MRGGEACAPIWRWRRGLLAVSGMSPTPRELRRVYPGVYPGLETEGHASLMRSRRALGPARAPFFGTFGAVFTPLFTSFFHARARGRRVGQLEPPAGKTC